MDTDVIVHQQEIRRNWIAAKVANAKRTNPDGLAQLVFPGTWVVNMNTPLESIRFMYTVDKTSGGQVYVEYVLIGMFHIGGKVSRKASGTAYGETAYDALITLIAAEFPIE